MAFEFEKEDTSIEKLITDIPYHSMKAEFEKLGIGDVWKGGRKKADMIKEAVEKLAKIKKSIDNGASEKEALEELPKQEAEEISEAELRNIEIAKEKIKEREEKISALRAIYTKDGVLDIDAIKCSLKKTNKSIVRNSFNKALKLIHIANQELLETLLEKDS